LGEYPQSSAWARCKQTAGWNFLRHANRCEGRIAGGFQLLWRQTRCGRIGYVSKGPVAWREEPEAVSNLVRSLIVAAKRLRLSALVVQPPGRSRLLPRQLSLSGFLTNRVLEVVTATLVLDLSIGMAAVESRMRKTSLKHLRSALRRGVEVREGKREDLESLLSEIVSS